MAAGGYIGKISAVVTANTSSLSRGLAKAGGDADKFANRLKLSITSASRAAADSVDGIFTRFQRLERNLRAALQINIVTTDEARKLEQLASVAEQVNKPLASAARQFEGLSLSVQGAFLPALLKAQSRAEALSETLSKGGTVSRQAFEEARRGAENATKAIQVLSQAQALANQAFRGDELQFDNPRLFQELTAGAKATRAAADLSPERLSGTTGVAPKLVRDLARLTDQLLVADAAFANAGVGENIDLENLRFAKAELDSLLDKYQATRTALEKELQIGVEVKDNSRALALTRQPQQRQGLGLFGSQVGTEADRAIEKARLLDAEFRKLPEAAQQGISGLASIASRLADEVAENEGGVVSLEKVLERLKARIEEAKQVAATSRLAILSPEDLTADRRKAAQQLISQAESSGLSRGAQLAGSAISGLQGTIDSLPATLRSRLQPALQDVEREFVELAGAANPPISQLQRLEDQIGRLSSRARRSDIAASLRNGFGGAGTAGVNAGLNEGAVQGYTAQLQILQRTLIGTSGAARTQGVQAFNALRSAIAQAMEEGTIDTAAVRKQLEELTRQAVKAAAAAAGIGVGSLGRQVQRAGDIGRGGFDKFTLGLNQAVFAIDDFFSVTGGLEQRIRALGNNVTQLGFIIGGTAGLITGLATVLVAQGVVAYLKFANGGKTAEDSTKALNDALSKQIGIAQELASAISALGDTLRENLFSDSIADAVEFSRQISDLQKKQEELRDARVVELDPQASQSGAEINRIDRELQTETDIGRRAALLTQRRRAEEQQRRRPEEIRAQPLPTTVDTAVEAKSRVSLETAQQIDDVLLAAAGGQQNEQIRAQLEAIRLAREELADQATDRVPILNVDEQDTRDAQQTILRLTEQEARLRDELAQSIDRSTVDILTAGRNARNRIEKLQEAAQSAIDAGATGGESLRQQADGLGIALQRAVGELEAASQIDDEVQRQDAVEAARRQVEAVQAAIDATREQRSITLSLTRALVDFKAAIDSVTAAADSNLRSAESRRDDRRRDVAANFGGERGRRNRDALEAEQLELESQRQSRIELEREVAAARERASRGNDPESSRFSQRLVEIDDLLQRNNLGDQQRRDLLFERDVVEQQLRLRQQAVVDADPAVQAAILRDEEVARRGRDVAAGLDLRATPEQRAGEEVAERLRQLTEAEDALVNARLAGPLDAARLQEIQAIRDEFDVARNRVFGEAQRQAAPGIFALADQVQNAILQGPSRAALEVTDVSTVEGARELNRLLRGDDAAKDQADLLELQRQTAALDELVRIAREQGVPIAP